MLEMLGRIFVGHPARAGVVAAILVAGYFLQRHNDRVSRALAVAALTWLLYAAWEWLILLRTPEANIRVDLLIIYPVLAAATAWALVRLVLLRS
jgi:hypothetical protein